MRAEYVEQRETNMNKTRLGIIGAIARQPELPRVVMSASPASMLSVTSRTLSTSLMVVGEVSPAVPWYKPAFMPNT